MMEEATAASPPPPKKRRVATADKQGGGEEETWTWTGSPLLLLATVAEEEERERKATKEGRAVDYSMNAMGLPPPTTINQQRHTVRIPLKEKMAAPVLPPTTTSATPEVGAASAKGPALHPTTGDDALGAKKEKSKRPYKRLDTGRKEPARMGWAEKVVRMGGWNPWFAVKKQLFDTDLSAHHSRLLLPASKDSDASRGGSEKLVYVLADAEVEAFFSDEGLPVTVLDRWGQEYRGGVMKHWKKAEWTVINGGGVWMAAARCMGLKTGEVLELFTFRVGPERKDAGGVVLVLITADPQLGAAAEE